jgi:uncharacterized protein YprB with RNaseH-like and TPR domain
LTSTARNTGRRKKATRFITACNAVKLAGNIQKVTEANVEQLRVLALDIETSLMKAYVFNTGEQFIGHSDIETDWHILSFGAKWVGDADSKLIYKDTQNGDDRGILKVLWELLDKADIVLTQNGTKFDAKKINARFMVHGFPPPKPYVHFDTYKLTKKVASFTSHSLAYLTSKFCTKHKKTSHGEFPGKTLWIEYSKGNPKARKAMREYNIDDVLSLEELYLKIRAWAPDSMPKVFAMTVGSRECGTCGYEGPMREGRPRYSKKGVYKQHSCKSCGAWQPAEKMKGEKK